MAESWELLTSCGEVEAPAILKQLSSNLTVELAENVLDISRAVVPFLSVSTCKDDAMVVLRYLIVNGSARESVLALQEGIDCSGNTDAVSSLTDLLVEAFHFLKRRGALMDDAVRGLAAHVDSLFDELDAPDVDVTMASVLQGSCFVSCVAFLEAMAKDVGGGFDPDGSSDRERQCRALLSFSLRLIAPLMFSSAHSPSPPAPRTAGRSKPPTPLLVPVVEQTARRLLDAMKCLGVAPMHVFTYATRKLRFDAEDTEGFVEESMLGAAAYVYMWHVQGFASGPPIPPEQALTLATSYIIALLSSDSSVHVSAKGTGLLRALAYQVPLHSMHVEAMEQPGSPLLNIAQALINHMVTCPIEAYRMEAFGGLKEVLTVLEDGTRHSLLMCLLTECPYPVVVGLLVHTLKQEYLSGCALDNPSSSPFVNSATVRTVTRLLTVDEEQFVERLDVIQNCLNFYRIILARDRPTNVTGVWTEGQQATMKSILQSLTLHATSLDSTLSTRIEEISTQSEQTPSVTHPGASPVVSIAEAPSMSSKEEVAAIRANVGAIHMLLEVIGIVEEQMQDAVAEDT